MKEAAYPSLFRIEEANELAVVDGREKPGPPVLSRAILPSVTPKGGGSEGLCAAEAGSVLAEQTLQPRATAVAIVVETAASRTGFVVVGLTEVIQEGHLEHDAEKPWLRLMLTLSLRLALKAGH
jgi:hypothetical protein